MYQAWQQKNDDKTTKSSGKSDDGANRRIKTCHENANGENDGIDGCNVVKLFMFPSDDEEKGLLSENVHDERKNRCKLEENKRSADHSEGIVQVKIVKEVLLKMKSSEK